MAEWPAASADGKFDYELAESSARFLSYLDGFSSCKTSLSSSRQATLVDRVENLAQESNPGPAARITVLKEEVAHCEEMSRGLETGEAPPLPPEDAAVEDAATSWIWPPPCRPTANACATAWKRCCTTCAWKWWNPTEVNRLERTTWPSSDVPMQMHLDLTVPDREALEHQHSRALGLGAELLFDRTDDPDEPLYVYADPSGHPFCIFVA